MDVPIVGIRPPRSGPGPPRPKCLSFFSFQDLLPKRYLQRRHAFFFCFTFPVISLPYVLSFGGFCYVVPFREGACLVSAFPLSAPQPPLGITIPLFKYIRNLHLQGTFFFFSPWFGQQWVLCLFPLKSTPGSSFDPGPFLFF